MKSVAIMDFFAVLFLIFTVWVNKNYQIGAEFAAVYAVLKCAVFNPAIFDAIRFEKWVSK